MSLMITSRLSGAYPGLSTNQPSDLIGVIFTGRPLGGLERDLYSPSELSLKAGESRSSNSWREVTAKRICSSVNTQMRTISLAVGPWLPDRGSSSFYRLPCSPTVLPTRASTSLATKCWRQMPTFQDLLGCLGARALLVSFGEGQGGSGSHQPRPARSCHECGLDTDQTPWVRAPAGVQGAPTPV